MLLRSPLLPFFPGAAANPSRHHEHAKAVSALPETIVLVVALEADCIEMHVERVTQLCVLSIRLRAEEHVGRPAATANQDSAAIYAKETSAFRCRFRRDLTNAKRHAVIVRHPRTDHEVECEVVERGLSTALLHRPPEAWLAKAQLRKTVGSETDQRAVTRTNCDRSSEGDQADAAPQGSGDRSRREILQVR